ncbi:hypothetical protein U1Q18_039925 [Sarracenia purpurea var. burkii]
MAMTERRRATIEETKGDWENEGRRQFVHQRRRWHTRKAEGSGALGRRKGTAIEGTKDDNDLQIGDTSGDVRWQSRQWRRFG